jgi:hypothetical protein
MLMKMEVKIIFEDENLIVIDKPAGKTSHDVVSDVKGEAGLFPVKVEVVHAARGRGEHDVIALTNKRPIFAPSSTLNVVIWQANTKNGRLNAVREQVPDRMAIKFDV